MPKEGDKIEVYILPGGTTYRTLNSLGWSPCDEKTEEFGSSYCIDYCQGSCWENSDVEYEEWEEEESKKTVFEIDFSHIQKAIITMLKENGLANFKMGISAINIRYEIETPFSQLEMAYPSKRYHDARILANGKVRILT
jgi:hypothetical protein